MESRRYRVFIWKDESSGDAGILTLFLDECSSSLIWLLPLLASLKMICSCRVPVSFFFWNLPTLTPDLTVGIKKLIYVKHLEQPGNGVLHQLILFSLLLMLWLLLILFLSLSLFWLSTAVARLVSLLSFYFLWSPLYFRDFQMCDSDLRLSWEVCWNEIWGPKLWFTGLSGLVMGPRNWHLY